MKRWISWVLVFFVARLSEAATNEWFSLTSEVVASGNPVGDDGLVRNFQAPVLRVTRTESKVPQGTVLLFPGGAYRILDVTGEGGCTEEQLNAFGYDVVRLEYSVGESCPQEAALMDALSAWTLVTSNPETLGIHGNRFAVMGYSAGGHLAARLVQSLAESKDAQPDDLILVYPAYLEEGTVLPPKNPSARLTVVMAANDRENWMAGAHAYADAWSAAGGYAIFQEFNTGGHGFGMKANLEGDLAQWPAVLNYFLENGPKPGVGPFNTYLPWFLKNNEGRLRTFRKEKERDMGSLVFFGDSITRKWDLASAFPELRTANRGIAGDTTRGMLCRVQENVVELHPSAVVFMGGINDLQSQPIASPEIIAANVRSILEKLNTSTPVFLCETFPSKSVSLETVRAVNAAVDQVITDFPNVQRVKTFDVFLNADGTLNESLFLDGTHPNTAGYAVWKKVLEPELEKLVSGK